MMKSIATLLLCFAALFGPLEAFTAVKPQTISAHSAAHFTSSAVSSPRISSSKLNVVTADLDVVALVAGQENYGFAIVALGEAIWSFAQAPSFDHAKVLAPASIAAVILVAVSGPMITSGDADSAALGLKIATGISALLGASYVARLAAPSSPSPKEAAFLGLLVALAGFFSFSQNLIVDGFVTLPNLPSIPFPQLQLGQGESINTDRY
eukprot:CAMPEP_0172302864 /NCGR_PEP_ID=MMETSP1058-20130122/4511_1 /TAXON_ID=83371 /ORGANISM="Detonula confervacea, Strain CCMP 353" /LENGTH=208 /DNA_ID=CAMNT_0013013507 /DNA_START=33 /DNA_END=659 /DNA_ORIENTATION=-